MTEQELQVYNEDDSLPSFQMKESGSYDAEFNLALEKLQLEFMENRLDDPIFEELLEDCRDDELMEYSDDKSKVPVLSFSCKDGEEFVETHDNRDDAVSPKDKSIFAEEQVHQENEDQNGLNEMSVQESESVSSHWDHSKVVTTSASCNETDSIVDQNVSVPRFTQRHQGLATERFLVKASAMDDTASTVCESYSDASSTTSLESRPCVKFVDIDKTGTPILEVEYSLSDYQRQLDIAKYFSEKKRLEDYIHEDTLQVEHSLSEYDIRVCLDDLKNQHSIIEELDEDSNDDEWDDYDSEDEDSALFSVNTLEKEEFNEFVAEHFPEIGWMGMLVLDLSEQEKELDEFYADDEDWELACSAPNTCSPHDVDVKSKQLTYSASDNSSLCDTPRPHKVDFGSHFDEVSKNNYDEETDTIPYSKAWFAERTYQVALLLDAGSYLYEDDLDLVVPETESVSSNFSLDSENSIVRVPYHQKRTTNKMMDFLGFSLEVLKMEPHVYHA